MLLILAGLLASQPADATPSAPAKAAKPQQVCQMMEITGSRGRKRVCRDASGRLDLGPGVSNSAYGKGLMVGHGGSTGEAASGMSAQ